MEDQNELRARLDELAVLKEDANVKQREADAAKAKHDEAQATLWHDMDAAGMKGFKTDQHSFARKATIYSTIQDADAFEAWCQENGLTEDYLKMAPKKQQLNELVRERLDNGQSLPEGVHWYAREYIAISKTKE